MARRQGLTIALGVLMSAAAIWYANAASAWPQGLLGFPWPPAERGIAAGQILVSFAARWIVWLRAALLLPAVAYLWGRFRRQSAARGGGANVAALGLALVAQSFLLEERILVGVLAYGLAAGIYLTRPRRWDTAPTVSWASHEPIVALLLLGCFLAASIYGLDLVPVPDFDEQGFAIAARMQAGEIPEGPVLGYDLKRFQGLPVPLFLQTLAVRIFHPGLLSIRLVAVAAGALTRVMATVAFRRFGGRVVLWVLALAAFSPAYLHYSRWGHYTMVSVLHGVIAVSLLFAFVERWRVGTAVLLGFVLGASIYCYQLSWLVPAIAGLCLLAVPALRRRPGAGVRAAVIAGTCIVSMLPAFTIRYQEFQAVGAQTFDRRALWYGRNPWASTDPARILAHKAASPEDVAALRRLLEAQGLRVQVTTTDRRVFLTLTGPPEATRAARADIERLSWTIIDDTGERYTPWGHAAVALRSLYRPGQDLFNPIRAPFLDPVSVSLLFLGFLYGVRHWHVPTLRILTVWVVCGALLPSMLGYPVYRRMLLMLPGAYAIMGLALEEVMRDLRSTGRWSRMGSVVFAGVLMTVIAVTNLYAYHRLWNPTADPDGQSILLLGKMVLGLPANERVLVSVPTGKGAALFAGQYLAWVGRTRHDGSARVFMFARPPAPAAVHRISCAQEKPFAWIVDKGQGEASAFERLPLQFECESSSRGPYRLYRVKSARPGVCPDRVAPPPGPSGGDSTAPLG